MQPVTALRLIMVIVIAKCAISTCSTIEVVNSTSSCLSGVRCTTLLNCLENPGACFGSNIKLSFTDKHYTVENGNGALYVVSNISNLTLTGNNATILCTRRAGFAFINITSLKMQGLHLSRCGCIMPETIQSQVHLTRSLADASFFMSPGTRVALLFGYIDNLTLQNFKVDHSHGYGAVITNSKWVIISKSNFSFNNYLVLDCYKGTTFNITCCQALYYSPDDVDTEVAMNCNGGNLVIFDTDIVPYTSTTHTLISNTFITHGVNLDIQPAFNRSYAYTAGGLSIFIARQLHSGATFIQHSTIASNVGHIAANTVVYLLDYTGHNYFVQITHTGFYRGNSELQHFAKTAQSGGVTVMYGFVDEIQHRIYSGQRAHKKVFIDNCTFSGNMAYTAGALLFNSYIVRDKRLQATVRMYNCILQDNYGYDTILSLRGNLGNRVYNIDIQIHQVQLLDNNLLNQPMLNDVLIAYRHSPHISTLHIEGTRTVTCSGVTIRNNQLRGISAREISILTFQGTSNISGNSGTDGGGMQLDRVLILLPDSDTRLYMYDNRATLSGGGMYVVDSTTRKTIQFCFFNVRDGRCRLALPFHDRIVMRNNSASISGNSIYGGNIDGCQILDCNPELLTGLEAFKQVFSIPWNMSLTEVASDFRQLCFCINGRPACGMHTWSVETYPGEQLHVSAVAVGQLNGTTPAIVEIRINSEAPQSRVAEQERKQQVGVVCQKLNYTIHSLENTKMEIRIGIFLSSRGFISNRSILVSTAECPTGFELDKSLVCSCVNFLERNGISCFLDMQNFQRPSSSVWVGSNTINNEFLAHQNCPLHKCRSNVTTTFTFNATDHQCERGFAGIVCGGCRNNLSAVLGSNACKPCSNLYSLLVVSIFVLAGILLVLAMLYGDLTVNQGTFNGMIMYANIVHIHRMTFFGSTHSSVITVIIAWLNLDIGVELCFYDGLDFFTRACLQYLFPTYIISLSMFLLFLNWYTSLGAKTIGNNIASVTASLILLSYTKYLRIVSESLSFTAITSSLGHSKSVWLYDGNVPFMQDKHTALSIVALAVLVGCIIPFTALMVFERLLLSYKTRQILVRLQLTTLISIYQASYKNSLRWWTGMMLLVRVALVTLYQVNILGNQRLNLVIIVSLGLCILGTMWNMGSLYRTKYITMIEAFYIANLLLLAGWNVYISSARIRLILSYILVTAALMLFIATVLYHIITRLIRVVKEKRKVVRDQPVVMENMENSDYYEPTNAPPKSSYIRVTGNQQPLTKLLNNT